LPGAAPPGAGRLGAGHLVGGRRPAAPRLRADPGRLAHAGCRTGNVAGVLRTRPRAPGACTAAGNVMTGRAVPPHPGAPKAIESYLAEVASALPGASRARGDIVAELRGGLPDAIDAHRSARLTEDTAPDRALPGRRSPCCGPPPPWPATSASAPPRPGNGPAPRLTPGWPSPWPPPPSP